MHALDPSATCRLDQRLPSTRHADTVHAIGDRLKVTGDR
jgi:hypothetical protein